MQFKVPQDIQREDKIVGPLTMKQLITLSIGGIIAYAIFIALAKTYIWITWLPPVAIITIITLALTFIKPLNLSFEKWLLLWIEFSILPRKRKWIKSSAEIILPTNTNTNQKTYLKTKKEEIDIITEKQKKLEDLKKFLNSQHKNKKI